MPPHAMAARPRQGDAAAGVDRVAERKINFRSLQKPAVPGFQAIGKLASIPVKSKIIRATPGSSG